MSVTKASKICAALIYLTIGLNFFCAGKNDKTNSSNAEPGSPVEYADTTSHLNGKRLFGLYCLTCHRISQNPLLGNSEHISLNNFIYKVMKDSIIVSADKLKNTHPKFEILTRKDISDIKYFLDKG
jgi:hypothetical protein